MGYLALLASVVVDIFQVEGMNVTWKVAEESEDDVDEEISTTATNYEHAHRWDWQAQLVYAVWAGDPWHRLRQNLQRRVMRTTRMAGAASDMVVDGKRCILAVL